MRAMDRVQRTKKETATLWNSNFSVWYRKREDVAPNDLNCEELFVDAWRYVKHVRIVWSLNQSGTLRGLNRRSLGTRRSSSPYANHIVATRIRSQNSRGRSRLPSRLPSLLVTVVTQRLPTYETGLQPICIGFQRCRSVVPSECSISTCSIRGWALVTRICRLFRIV